MQHANKVRLSRRAGKSYVMAWVHYIWEIASKSRSSFLLLSQKLHTPIFSEEHRGLVARCWSIEDYIALA